MLTILCLPAFPYTLDAAEKCWGEGSEDGVLAN